MRLFIVSYQKSGTHQIMPALDAVKDVVDRSWLDMTTVPRKFGTQRYRNEEGVLETCEKLREFTKSAFGHLPYNDEYLEALRSIPTKILFNVRDPRDIVVANFHSIRKVYFEKKRGSGHLNFYCADEGKVLIEMDDPISELIQVEAERWKHWIGWHGVDDVMTVKYEQLRIAPRETIEEIAKFVHPFPIDIAKSTSGLVPNHANPTFRAGRIGDWKQDFNDAHKELANELMRDTITQLGYEL